MVSDTPPPGNWRPDFTNYRPGKHLGGPPVGTRAEQMRLAMDDRYREMRYLSSADELGIRRRPRLYRRPRGARRPGPVDRLVFDIELSEAAAAQFEDHVVGAWLQRVAADPDLARGIASILQEAST